MALIQRIRAKFAKPDEDLSTGTNKLSEAAAVLADKRGNNVSAQPAERGGYSPENLAEAGKDLGPSTITGRDAIGDVGKGYRAAE